MPISWLLCRETFQVLSDPVAIMTIDFQAALDSKTRLEEKLQQTRVMNLRMNKAGQCNAVVSWFQVRPSGRQVVIFLQEALPHPAANAWGDAPHAAEGDLLWGGGGIYYRVYLL